jgi:hypothetical protein
MFLHSEITKYAILGLVETGQPFDIEDVKTVIETILDDNNKYYDPIELKELKSYLLELFEKGYMLGYCLSTRPIVDAEGPQIVMEFTPENPLGSIDLILKPEAGNKVQCVIDPQYKTLLKSICEKADCSQDVMVRSILVRALDLIYDQMK